MAPKTTSAPSSPNARSPAAPAAIAVVTAAMPSCRCSRPVTGTTSRFGTISVPDWPPLVPKPSPTFHSSSASAAPQPDLRTVARPYAVETVLISRCQISPPPPLAVGHLQSARGYAGITEPLFKLLINNDNGGPGGRTKTFDSISFFVGKNHKPSRIVPYAPRPMFGQSAGARHSRFFLSVLFQEAS